MSLADLEEAIHVLECVDEEYIPHDKAKYTSFLKVTPQPTFKLQKIKNEPYHPELTLGFPRPFRNSQVFEHVDTHAIDVSRLNHASVRHLVWNLIYTRDITNELEKARAIFVYLCFLRPPMLHFENVEKGSAEELMMNLKKGQATHAAVFTMLCSYSSLHCVTVRGYAKGAEFSAGMKLTGDACKHAWNCVNIEGSWWHVDCHWASRRLSGSEVVEEDLQDKLDAHFFLSDPRQLIFTHFPDEPRWQLLKHPVSLHTFENSVIVKSALFRLGLQIISHNKSVLHFRKQVSIRIGCPADTVDQLDFTYTLSYHGTGGQQYKGNELNSYGMQYMEGKQAVFDIRPPEAATYSLVIYAKNLRHGRNESYGGICEYKLACNYSPHPPPFPPCAQTSWGKIHHFHQYNLEAANNSAILNAAGGVAEVRLKMPKDMRFMVKLVSTKDDEETLEKYVLNRTVKDEAIFNVNLPCDGEYGLEIYANDPEKDGMDLHHVYQCLVIGQRVAPKVQAFPVLPQNHLGPQPAFRKSGLKTSNKDDPYMHTPGNAVDISFDVNEPVRVTSNLFHVTDGKDNDVSHYVLHQNSVTNVLVKLRLPKAGFYKLQIFACKQSDSAKGLPNVFNYLIKCDHNKTLWPFPKQYGKWQEAGVLEAPQDGKLSQAMGPNVYFKLKIPSANSVACKVGESWHQLEKEKDHQDIWQGQVPLSSHFGKENKLTVCANYSSVKESYSSLLEYMM